MVLAICAYLFVQPEIETKMLGVLRTLGVRESVFWASWWIPFLLISTVNAMLGAMTAKLIDDVHVFKSTSFGPLFVSILFLNIGLVGCSFLLVAVAGGARSLAALFIMIMLVAPWGPFIVVVNKSDIPYDAGVVNRPYLSTPVGIFWVNRNTVSSGTI